MYKTKLLAIVMLLTLMVGILGACGGNANTGSEENGAKNSGGGKSGDKVELSVLFADSLFAGIHAELIQEFEAAHPNIKIKAESLPDSGIFDALRIRVSTNEVPDAYQVNIGHITTGLANDAGYLADLSSYESMAGYSESIRNAVSIDGKPALFTLGVGVLGLAYNKDMLAEVGLSEPPKTWEAFMDAGKKLKEKGKDLFVYAGKGETMMGNVFHWAFGSYAVKDPAFKEAYLSNKIDWSKPEYRAILKEGFERFKELNQYTRVGSFTNEFTIAQQAFAEGDSAVLMSGTWEGGALRKLNPDMKLGFMNMPYAAEDQNAYIFVPEDGLAANAKSAHPEETKIFLNWMFSKETYAKILKAKGSFSAMPGVGELDESYTDVPAWLETDRIQSFANTGPVPNNTWVALGTFAQELTFQGDVEKSIDKFIAEYNKTIAK
ncbi:ABC transporter substrate-binding protein [Paenibacillus mendelii]|uniref:ABC transporter substrate-binding protein n=1 Tax=Paenibacillus mendelii TaxID=206163 RepID=A0ABV6J6H5_9BACL|nr:extracellular solute-binding protein [Paenibacillus mendelii]MCQ6561984.1 extracellular solute-binding protein [Paenibacillus mendelii]